MATFERVRKLLAHQIGIPEDRITPDSVIGSDLGADSLDVAEIILQLAEEDGDREIPDEVAEQFVASSQTTVQDIVDLLDGKSG